jgi:hypothetical protein
MPTKKSVKAPWEGVYKTLCLRKALEPYGAKKIDKCVQKI